MNTDLTILFGSTIFLAVGIGLWRKGNQLIGNGKKAKGIIFKNNYSFIDGGLYYPVIRFLTDKKEWITQELDVGYKIAKDEGTEIEILYDMDDPTNIQVNSNFELAILPRLFVAIGLFGFIIGVLEYLDYTDFL
jgi:hypothetical protein